MPPLDCNPPPTPPRGISPRQVVLGLFILGQLAFLILSNLIGLYQDAQSRIDPAVATVIDRVVPGYAGQTGHAWKTPDELSTALRRWAQLTGQDQSWSLFAPNVAKVTGFPAVVFVWEDPPTSGAALARTLALWCARDGVQAASTAVLLQLRPGELEPWPARAAAPAVSELAATLPLECLAFALAARDPRIAPPLPGVELLLSDNEPADPHHFLRVGRFRVRRYESNIILYLARAADESDAEARQRWAKSIREHLDENAEQLRAYLRWRLAVYQRRQPGRQAPRQVILLERTYRILPPDDESGACWDGPRSLPLARWLPGHDGNGGARPLERYNPVTERFEAVTK